MKKQTPPPELVKISDLTPEQIASLCDHTFLSRPEVFWAKGVKACAAFKEAFENFMLETVSSKLVPYAVCVRPEDVLHAKKFLDKHGKSKIRIASVVGFPYPDWYETEFVVYEASYAMKCGASEIDMVLCREKLKQGDLAGVENNISAVVDVAHSRNAIVKLILETSELSNKEIASVCKLAERLGVDFVKTSTGFSDAGAKAEHVRLMRANFSRGVKIAGGVNKENVYDLLAAASGRSDGMIELDPLMTRIGESKLLDQLLEGSSNIQNKH